MRRFVTRGSSHHPYISKTERQHEMLYPSLCPTCGRRTQDHRFCARCPSPLMGVIIGFAHSRRIKKLVRQMKYQRARTIGTYLGNQLGTLLTTHPLIGCQHLYLCPIPMHRYKKRCVRGYNQAALIASGIAQQTSTPIIQPLRKQRYHSQLQGKTKKQREETMHDVFALSSPPSLPPTSTILIIDDVYTTGATMRHAADILRSHYPTVDLWGCTVSKSISIQRS